MLYFVVYWPTCLIPQANEAELVGTEEHSAATSADSLTNCMTKCKETEACTYWTWNKVNSTCIFRGLLKVTGKSSKKFDAVSGEKYCTGEGKSIFRNHFVNEIMCILVLRKDSVKFTNC